jgi:dihydrofolate reductase
VLDTGKGSDVRILVINHVTVDGIAQAPGEPDEDRRGGFRHGGWGKPYVDAVVANAMAARMARPVSEGGLLLGRFTYEGFYAVWPKRTDNPYTEHLNKTRKYVASRTLKEPLPWSNSVLLHGDAAETVARLKKEEPGKDLCVLGSLKLVQSLMRAGLVDEYVMMIAPLVLGTGFRLFPEGGAFAKLHLVETTTTTTGVIIATYRSALTSPEEKPR